jgi:hypothetical protein
MSPLISGRQLDQAWLLQRNFDRSRSLGGDELASVFASISKSAMTTALSLPFVSLGWAANAQVDTYARIVDPFGESNTLTVLDFFFGLIFILMIFVVYISASSLWSGIEKNINENKNEHAVQKYITSINKLLVESDLLAQAMHVARTGDAHASLALAEYFGRQHKRLKILQTRYVGHSGGSAANKRNSLNQLEQEEFENLRNKNVSELFGHWLSVSEFLGAKAGYQGLDYFHYLSRLKKYGELQSWQLFPKSAHNFIVFMSLMDNFDFDNNSIDWNSTSPFGLPSVQNMLYHEFKNQLSKDIDSGMNGYLIAAIDFSIVGRTSEIFCDSLIHSYRKIQDVDLFSDPYSAPIGNLARHCRSADFRFGRL